LHRIAETALKEDETKRALQMERFRIEDEERRIRLTIQRYQMGFNTSALGKRLENFVTLVQLKRCYEFSYCSAICIFFYKKFVIFGHVGVWKYSATILLCFFNIIHYCGPGSKMQN
jgi:hypothetical protein